MFIKLIRFYKICISNDTFTVLNNCGMIFFILSFFVGYIFSFGLVRLSVRASTHIERRCSRSRRENVTITDVIIKTLDRKWDWVCEWRHDRKRWAEDLRGFLKKSCLLRFQSRRGELIFWIWARPVQLWTTRCSARCGVRWNSQHSKNCVSLSACWKPESQEGNKSFVPELPVFRDSLCIFRIFISWSYFGGYATTG